MKLLNSRKKLSIFIICSLAFIGGGGFFLNKENANKQNTQEIIPYNVGTLSSEAHGNDSMNLTGSIVANNTSEITINPSRGKVTQLFVKEGDKVIKGQKLFQYANPDGDFAIRESELNVKIQEKLLAQKKQDKVQKTKELSNKKKDMQSAVEPEKKVVKEEVSQMTAELSDLESEIENVTLELEKAQMVVKTNKEKYGQTIVVAEFDGVVKKINKEQMEKSDGSDIFITIIDHSSLYVEGTVNEFQKDKIQLQQKTKIIERGNQNKSWDGEITTIGSITVEDDGNNNSEENPNMSKYPFKAKFKTTEDAPSIGKHVFVQVMPPESNDIKIPREYIVKKDDKTYVWKVENNKVKKVEVETVEIKGSENVVKIVRGLTKDDHLVFPFPNLKNEMEVGSNVVVE
ncbi:efflux RND transporter periplasmic adaptor subunit [Bacillus sp. 1P06AnD]|uniref:efflux RND transporter periplasmic adaptor subunit n=1 Tax=Bacillus sp. 1P06AnD TaxID=3132208 RepID=UPI0039A093E9